MNTSNENIIYLNIHTQILLLKFTDIQEVVCRACIHIGSAVFGPPSPNVAPTLRRTLQSLAPLSAQNDSKKV